MRNTCSLDGVLHGALQWWQRSLHTRRPARRRPTTFIIMWYLKLSNLLVTLQWRQSRRTSRPARRQPTPSCWIWMRRTSSRPASLAGAQTSLPSCMFSICMRAQAAQCTCDCELSRAGTGVCILAAVDSVETSSATAPTASDHMMSMILAWHRREAGGAKPDAGAGREPGGGGALAVVVDAEVTSYLMMGALSPGLKRHSVSLFEGALCCQTPCDVSEVCCTSKSELKPLPCASAALRHALAIILASGGMSVSERCCSAPLCHGLQAAASRAQTASRR